jgi:F420-0:gamma-glutamyl ligase
MNPRTKRVKFQKEMIVFRNPRTVIEATEFGDVLLTAGIDVSQGPETPTELSDDTLQTCGQSTVFPMHMSYNTDIKVD